MTMDDSQPPANKKQKTGGEHLPQIVSVSSFDIDCASSCQSSSTLPSLHTESGCVSEHVVCPEESPPHDEDSKTAMATSQSDQTLTDVPTHLRTLATTTSQEEALQAMKTLYTCLGSDAHKATGVAQQITSDLWFSSIIGCLARYERSEEFSLLVITFLATLLFYEPKTSGVLVDLRAIDTILHTAMTHPGSELMSVNAVGLVSNLACEAGEVRASVSHPKHIAFMADNMKWKPYNESIQSAGCIYFKHVTEGAQGTPKSLLEENDVVMSLGIAMKTFRCSNEYMYACAKEVVKHIVS
mmetsp:Transcript_28171/g.43404  ORF Transcript_28171/g.43404 Transcript_28171/m.43404 type:complete len:298 (+) Transcript_28171:63-956(+)|eukprot:CAMPEP_0117035078 /NCGR_PEP_ID=MMETSP0472-20121206/24935_1 /TAXON_ID=693140 ORGANISM="Tiarina fusus, Strain LIS" /NCGR_SAMPLE_ID=MMETSP0472 /ASSEMBLY_ACC=CAM_ASM_000603 /LENGTH=297 /DNA_ID=CAMNT_0004744441 /DNA_START=55 /DNA_END=948 /DNA_ORIENTATION=+